VVRLSAGDIRLLSSAIGTVVTVVFEVARVAVKVLTTDAVQQA